MIRFSKRAALALAFLATPAVAFAMVASSTCCCCHECEACDDCCDCCQDGVCLMAADPSADCCDACPLD